MNVSEIKQQVIDLLQEYPTLAEQITLLRYEIEHPSGVSAHDVIESMTFAKPSAEGSRPASYISNKTLYIALNYQDAAESGSTELHDELVNELFLLERKKNRLEYYLSLLPECEQEVIRLCYFERKPLRDVAHELGVSIWYVRRHKDEAIDRLSQMYEYVFSKTN